MSDNANPTQRDTAVIPIPHSAGAYPPHNIAGQPAYQQSAPGPAGAANPPPYHPGSAFPGGYPMSGSVPGVDPGAHWYAQFRKQRRRTRLLALSTAVLAITCVLLAGTAWALFRANELSNQVSGVLPGISGLIGRPDSTPPTPGPTTAPDSSTTLPPSSGQEASPQPLAPQQTPPAPATAPTTDPDLAELSDLVAGLKNEDGSLNPLGVAALAGKLGALAEDPQKLNSLIDQAQQQGMIDPQVAGLLRGALASSATTG